MLEFLIAVATVCSRINNFPQQAECRTFYIDCFYSQRIESRSDSTIAAICLKKDWNK
jgi:hypothetical protein